MVHPSTRMFSVLATGVLATGALTMPSAQGAASAVRSTQTAPAAAATHRTTARLRTSTSRLPHSATHAGGGAVNLTEDGHLQRYVNRSSSPRPKLSHNAAGRRVLRAAAQPSWLPVVSPSAVASTKPGALKGWEGLNEVDNEKYAGFSLEPPDQGLCAGGGHVFEMINDVVRVYSTNGTSQGTAFLNDFFKEPGTDFTTDPSCVFDAGSQRYYATELTLNVDPDTGAFTERNSLDLAVSKTSDPRGGWNIYTIDVTDDGTNGTPKHRDCPCIGDYPHLATDAHGVFLTTNEYPFEGDGFNGAQIYALSKTKVARGASSVDVVNFENVRVPQASGPSRLGFTLIPAQSAGDGYAKEHNGSIYFLSSFAAEEARPDDFTGHASQIGTWWIGNTASLGSRPRLVLRERSLHTRSYGIPPLSNQKPGPVPLRDCIAVQCVDGLGGPYSPEQEGGLDSSDTRVMTATYVDGQLFAALDTAVQVSGSVQAGFEWFAVNASGSTSRLARQGYVGIAGGNAIYPAITTDDTGSGYVGFTIAGDRWYPSAGYAKWASAPGGRLHVAGSGAAPEDGFCEYLAFNCGGTDTPSIRPRWGDYAGAAWDGHHFYLANEYIAHRCTYRQFASDVTCGGTRTFYGNFSTHVHKLS